MRLVVYEIDQDNNTKDILSAKEQEVYMGEVPMMTNSGTFITNGVQRVVVNQMHRSPGVFFDHDKGKSHSSGKILYAARIIPYRGSWLDFEFDAKDLVYARIDRKRKIPVSTILFALGYDAEDILGYFYKKYTVEMNKKGWVSDFKDAQYKGIKISSDLINADTGEVAAEAGTKMTPRYINKLKEAGLKKILYAKESLIGQFVAEDVVNIKTGLILSLIHI